MLKNTLHRLQILVDLAECSLEIAVNYWQKDEVIIQGNDREYIYVLYIVLGYEIMVEVVTLTAPVGGGGGQTCTITNRVHIWTPKYSCLQS